MMRRVALGPGGPEVSELAFGCWRFLDESVERSTALIEAVAASGIDLIDTADIYGFGGIGFGGAERILGDVFRARTDLKAKFRVATKGGIFPGQPYDSSPDYLERALEASLERLGLTHVDLYQIHRPDLLAGWKATAGALNRMRADGRIGAVGVSNFTVSQMRALEAHLSEPVASLQSEWSAFEPAPLEDGALDWCEETGAAFMAWSPLAGGRLATGEVRSEAERRVLAVMDRLAAEKSTNRAAVATAFLRAHPVRPIVILGTQKAERVAQAVADLSITLERREWYDVLEAWRGAPMP